MATNISSPYTPINIMNIIDPARLFTNHPSTTITAIILIGSMGGYIYYYQDGFINFYNKVRDFFRATNNPYETIRNKIVDIAKKIFTAIAGSFHRLENLSYNHPYLAATVILILLMTTSVITCESLLIVCNKTTDAAAAILTLLGCNEAASIATASPIMLTAGVITGVIIGLWVLVQCIDKGRRF